MVKALRCWSDRFGIDSQCCRRGFFSRIPTEPCALGLNQPLKMSTRKTHGGKDGRCLRVTTLLPSYCRKSRKFGALTYRIRKVLLKPVGGKLFLYKDPIYCICLSKCAVVKAVKATYNTEVRFWKFFRNVNLGF